MANILNSQYITTISAKFQCCAASLAKSLLSCETNNPHKKTNKDINKLKLVEKSVEILDSYVPIGTVLQEGFVAFAILDLSAFSSFGNLSGSVVVQGNIIAILPDGDYLDIDELITALVDAINNSGSPYTATDSGAGTITINTSTPSAQANGFVISIQINPTFSMVEELQFDNTTFRQPIQINDPTSVNYEKTLIAKLGPAGQSVEVFENRTFDQSVFIGNNGVWGAYAIAHQQNTDRVWTAAFLPGGVFTVLNSDFTINNFYASGAGAGWGIYNTVNDCLYFAGTSSNRVIKIDSAGVQTNITGTTGVTKLAFDPNNGTVWGIGTNSLFLIDTSDVVTPIATPGENPVSINYWSTANLMLVAFKNINTIRTYDMTGAVDTATFYTFVSVDTVFYSSIYNLIFAGGTTDVDIIREDGSLRQNLSVGAAEFLQDEVSNDIIGVFSAGGVGFVRYFALLNDGEEVFDSALLGGVDPVLSDGSENCLSEDEVKQLIASVNKNCNCSNIHSINVITPPSEPILYVVYFGNSSETNLDNTEIPSLDSVSIATMTHAYDFEATAPSEYKYIAIPTSLGLPSRIYDPDTNFDVAMDTVYQVTISSVQYNVFRTFFPLGGEITITFKK